jgi:O-acetyl-ADP-ribose deacetylase (regulator of RNase III)
MTKDIGITKTIAGRHMNNIHLLVNQDIFNHSAQVILHQANCFTTMGSGIAAAIRGLYPEAYEVDCKTIRGDKNKLGTFSWVKGKRDGKIIINMYSQYNYGRESRKTNYEAFANGLEKVRDFMIEKKLQSLSIPYKIGCNLGGGDYRIIEKIIEVTFENAPFDVFICKKE